MNKLYKMSMGIIILFSFFNMTTFNLAFYQIIFVYTNIPGNIVSITKPIKCIVQKKK